MFESPERKNCRQCGNANLLESVYCCMCSARFESIELSDAQRQDVNLLVKKAEATGLPRGAIFPIEGRSNRIVMPRGHFWQARLADFKFITHPVSQTAQLENAVLLVSDVEVGNVALMMPILEAGSKQSTPLVLIAPSYGSEFLTTLLVNKLRGTLRAALLVASGRAGLQNNFAGRPFDALPRLQKICASLFGTFVWTDHGSADEAAFLEFENESMLRLAVDLLLPQKDE